MPYQLALAFLDAMLNQHETDCEQPNSNTLVIQMPTAEFTMEAIKSNSDTVHHSAHHTSALSNLQVEQGGRACHIDLKVVYSNQ